MNQCYLCIFNSISSIKLEIVYGTFYHRNMDFYSIKCKKSCTE